MTNDATFRRILKAQEAKRQKREEQAVLDAIELPPAVMHDFGFAYSLKGYRRSERLNYRPPSGRRDQDGRSRPQARRTLEEAARKIERGMKILSD